MVVVLMVVVVVVMIEAAVLCTTVSDNASLLLTLFRFLFTLMKRKDEEAMGSVTLYCFHLHSTFSLS